MQKESQLVDKLDSLHYDAIELLDKGDYEGYKVKMQLIAETSKLLPDYAPVGWEWYFDVKGNEK